MEITNTNIKRKILGIVKKGGDKMRGKLLEIGKDTIRVEIGSEKKVLNASEQVVRFAHSIPIGAEIEIKEEEGMVKYITPANKFDKPKETNGDQFRTRDEIIRSDSLKCAVELLKINPTQKFEELLKMCETYIRGE